MLPATLQMAASERRGVTNAREKRTAAHVHTYETTCKCSGRTKRFHPGAARSAPAVFSFLQNLSAGDQTPAVYILNLASLQLIFGPLLAASPMETHREMLNLKPLQNLKRFLITRTQTSSVITALIPTLAWGKMLAIVAVE